MHLGSSSRPCLHPGHRLGDSDGVGEKIQVDSEEHGRRLSANAKLMFAEAAPANLACREQNSGVSPVNL